MVFEVLVSAPGGLLEEGNVHHKFNHLRFRRDDYPARNYTYGCPTEWFNPEPDLLRFIERVRQTGKIVLRPHERREDVFKKRYLAGETYQSIANDFGITRERVRQVLRAHGVPSLGHRPKPPSPWMQAYLARRAA